MSYKILAFFVYLFLVFIYLLVVIVSQSKWLK